MKSSNIPSKIPLPFAYAAGSGYINEIPTSSQIGIVNGRASLYDGFPPDTFTPISSGGVPPFGGDFNGILNEITSIQQWQEAGGSFPFDATFADAVGGYPKGAVLQSTSFAGYWISTIENNSNNPDTGGNGWVPDAWYGTQTIALSGSNVTLTNIQSAYPIIILTGTLTANINLIIPNYAGKWILVNNTTGAYTVTAKTASGTGVSLLQGYSTYVYGDTVNIYFANSAEVASFNGRTGTVTLNSSDVLSALGYTPVRSVDGVSGLDLTLPPPTIIFDGQIPYNSTTTFTVDPTRLTIWFINEGNGYGGNAGLYLGVSWGPGTLSNSLYFFNSGVDYQVTFAGALMKSMPAGNGSSLQIQPFGNFIGGYGAPSNAECLVMQF